MEVKEYLDIAELEGQLVEGTWCGYVLTLKNGKAYELKDGIRGWVSGLFYVKNGELEEVPDWNVSNLFETHLENMLQEVLEKYGTIDARNNSAIGKSIVKDIHRGWFKKWIGNQ